MAVETINSEKLIALTPRQVPVDRPWVWLSAGWRDLWKKPSVSITYGAVFAALGWLLIWLLLDAEHLWLVFPLTSGFFIVAPVLAVGLYETSRRLEVGKKISLLQAMNAWRNNAAQIGLIGVFLLVLHLFWIRLAQLLLPLFYTNGFGPDFSEMGTTLLQGSGLLPFVITGTLVGGLLAAIAFACCAFAIPILLDNPEMSAAQAMITSLRAVQANPQTMVFWAALIVISVGTGLVLMLFGLVVLLPLVGHATWHAYRDIFRSGEPVIRPA